MIRSVAPAVLLLLAGVAMAQDSNSTSRAEARAEASDSSSSSQTSSHTRRVVVVNGKTVVDEETVNGKPVKGKRRKGRRPAQLPVDAEQLLKELGRDLPAEAQKQLERALKNGATSRSHTRRVKVVNGKTVIDEETRDGKPVQGKRSSAQLPSDPEQLLKELGRDLPAEARERLNRALEDRAIRHGSAKRGAGSGERVAPKKTLGGKPVKPAETKPRSAGARQLRPIGPRSTRGR